MFVSDHGLPFFPERCVHNNSVNINDDPAFIKSHLFEGVSYLSENSADNIIVSSVSLLN